MNQASGTFIAKDVEEYRKENDTIDHRVHFEPEKPKDGEPEPILQYLSIRTPANFFEQGKRYVIEIREAEAATESQTISAAEVGDVKTVLPGETQAANLTAGDAL